MVLNNSLRHVLESLSISPDSIGIIEDNNGLGDSEYVVLEDNTSGIFLLAMEHEGHPGYTEISTNDIGREVLSNDIVNFLDQHFSEYIIEWPDFLAGHRSPIKKKARELATSD